VIAPGQSEATPRVRADISGEKSGKRESGKAGKTLTRIAPISTNYLTVPFCRHCGVAANCLSSVAVLQRMGCSPPSKKTSLGLKAAVVGVAVEVRRRCGGGPGDGQLEQRFETTGGGAKEGPREVEKEKSETLLRLLAWWPTIGESRCCPCGPWGVELNGAQIHGMKEFYLRRMEPQR